MFIHLTTYAKSGAEAPEVLAALNSNHIVAFGPLTNMDYPNANGAIVLASGGILYCKETPEQILSLLEPE